MCMRDWKKLISATGLCLALLAPLPLDALDAQLPLIYPQEEVVLPASLTLTGQLQYVDLEGGFYAVAGYRLVGDEQKFRDYLGQQVVVVGSLVDEISIFMTKAIRVEEISLLTASQELAIVGELTYEDLEGGFYAVAGYRLVGDEQKLAAHLGKHVIVTGEPLDDLSIYMTRTLDVKDLQAVPADEVIQTVGELVYEDIEGGYYAVNGYRLVGNPESLAPYLGQKVLLTGRISDEPSIFMNKAIDVVALSRVNLPEAEGQLEPELRLVAAVQPLPRQVTLDGAVVEFGQDLVVKDSILLVPLRAIVNAYGGKVAWSNQTRSARVELPDRVATFVTGANEVAIAQPDGNQNTRTVSLARAPELIGSRLHIPADALSTTLGLLARDTDDDILALVTPPQASEPSDDFDWGTVAGSIEQIEKRERTRILVKGESMSNGEPMLIWLAVDSDTQVRFSNSQEAASIADLAIGQQIIAALSGPVLESYPAQGGACRLIILA